MQKLTVAVLFGGRSNEHSISVATASGVLSAIDTNRYDVIPVGITKRGEFIPFNADPSSIALDKGLIELEAKGPSLRFELDGSKLLIELDATGKEVSRRVVDVVLPLLHGPYGEDGTLQGFLEMAQLPYVGNGVLASAAAMDKEFSKALFKAAGIPSPEHVIVYKSQMLDDPESALAKIRALGSFPVFVKPARAGSSVGITKVKAIDGIAAALESAFEHDEKAIIEVAVSGRELECGVLDGKNGAPLRVSVAGEIKVSGREFYDFEAKYVDKNSANLICPAELTEEELFEMQQLAKKAFRALGCKGLARVDFFLTDKGFMLSEINTMPGFTSISMFPRCWEQSGLSYSKLIDELIELALEN